MFSKTIFKQTLKENFKIWLIITAVLVVINVALIGVFDPKTISSMSEMVKGTPFADMLENTSFMGMLAQTFYSIQGIILPIIYIIMVASNLIVSQVDRGSMAYILSTPIKRSQVVITQVTYLVSSLFTMIAITTIAGVIAVQAFHGGVYGEKYTDDVIEVSNVLNIDKAEISDNLSLILNNEEALKLGAEVRGIDEDAYTAYLNLKITDTAYEAAADIMGIDVDEISNNPALMQDNAEALEAAAKIAGMDTDTYSLYIDKLTAEKEALANQSQAMQENLLNGFAAASEILGVEVSELTSDLSDLKANNKALNAAVEASGIPEEMLIAVVNNQIAANELSLDDGIGFTVPDYLRLNLGFFLLMFAISSISFMFSCIFNLSKQYMAFGAGIPLAFFLLHMMAQVSDSFKLMKYFTLNTLFDTNAILNAGDYVIQFIVLALVGIVLYIIGIRVFTEKDLPL